MGSTAVKVALLATCLLLQQTLAQRSGGAMVGSGSGSSEGVYGRSGRAGRGGSSDSSDSDTMAMTLGGELSCFCAFRASACSAHCASLLSISHLGQLKPPEHVMSRPAAPS